MTRACAATLSLVALTATILASPAFATAPGRTPCAKVERRAKAKLQRGLKTCTPRNAAACGASQWSRYRTALARKGCTPADEIAPGGLQPILRRPSVIAVRSSGGAARGLAPGGAAAHRAHPPPAPPPA